MAVNNLPADIQSIIQQGYLEREWEDALRAYMGFRAIADRSQFPVGVGETISRTRPGLIAPNMTPLAPASNTDLTSGMTPQNYSVEQFTIAIDQYSFGQTQLNLVTSKVAIQEQFLLNSAQVAYACRLGLDLLCERTLFSAYLGGNTVVSTTLSAAGTAVVVNDIRGFQTTFDASGQRVPVSSTYPVNVTVGSDLYSLVGAVAASTNVSTSPGGISGTLTFATAVSIADGTAGNAVISAVAPVIYRPSATGNPEAGVTTTAGITTSLYNSGRLNLSMVAAAAAQLKANGVPTDEDGYYICYADPFHFLGMYTDQAFQRFFMGRVDSPEYRRGLINDVMGIKVFETNVNPIQPSLGNGPIHRSIMCGQGALLEGEYTTQGYAGILAGGDEDMIALTDGVAHVVREPIDAFKQVITQSGVYIGGFVCPTDMTANPNTIPTANNSEFKRAIIMESL